MESPSLHAVLAANVKLRALPVQQEALGPAPAAPPAEHQVNCPRLPVVQLGWVELLKRLFEHDLACCPNCGGELRIAGTVQRGGGR